MTRRPAGIRNNSRPELSGHPAERKTVSMYAIPIALFAVILVVAVLALTVFSKRSNRHGDKKAPFAEDKRSPLWATDEGSDA